MTYKLTVDDLLQDLELAKQIAIKNDNANSLVTAVMAQAKLIGVESGNTVKVNDPQPIAVMVKVKDARRYEQG